MPTHRSDVLVLGSGIAGLATALKAAEHGLSVTVLAKRQAEETNTSYAQGGIASVFDSEDSFGSHIDDTLRAGAGLCRTEVVEAVVKEGPQRIADLVRWGVRFTRAGKSKDSPFDLTREGGHSAHRILHRADLTGAEIQRALTARARATPGIGIFEWRQAVDLIAERGQVLGAYVLDTATGEVETRLAKATVLATGGWSKVYLYTTNPDVASGDGLAMAWRAGATVSNLEFCQFHPTCLYHPDARRFLISEAVRGEGGILRTAKGRAFMGDFHPLKELAPRDVVARAIDAVLKASGDECVFLDVTHLPAGLIKRRFPNIYATCLRYGIDMVKKPVPVVPAAHYQCGGVTVGLMGESSVDRLYAVGEVACTGLHGANRLGSNSLLEALVFARRAEEDLRRKLKPLPAWFKPRHWDSGKAEAPDEGVVVTQNWDEVRRIMWNYVGIVRTDKRLERALRRIRLLRHEIRQYYWDFHVTGDLLELRNLALVAELIVRSARLRRESRGLHYNLDCPKTDSRRPPKDTVLKPPKDPKARRT
ncbi:MAG TPA: L-aspartate oxidase [bacterium]|jgi:L-aspartate oxidase|nr:L-aspartate oxidase [bacterium]